MQGRKTKARRKEGTKRQKERQNEIQTQKDKSTFFLFFFSFRSGYLRPQLSVRIKVFSKKGKCPQNTKNSLEHHKQIHYHNVVFCAFILHRQVVPRQDVLCMRWGMVFWFMDVCNRRVKCWLLCYVRAIIYTTHKCKAASTFNRLHATAVTSLLGFNGPKPS